MSIGSTTEDIDGVSKNIDRGPPEENRMTEAELRGTMRTIADAKETIGKAATINGLYEEVQVIKHMMDDMTEQHNRLISLYSTLKNQFDQFQKQRAIELNSWVAGGSTSPEDN